MRKKQLQLMGAALALAVVMAIGEADVRGAAPEYQIVQVGLTGEGYGFPIASGTWQQSGAFRLNDSGRVVGTSERFNGTTANLGHDTWLYDGTSNHLIGLVGGDYEYNSVSAGGGIFRQSDPVQLNGAGQVLGTSNRYSAPGNDLGRDSWLHDGGTTQLIGLTGIGYEYMDIFAGKTRRYDNAVQLNEAGQATGFSIRYQASGLVLGTDAWFYNGTTSQVIGLTGSGYDYNSGGGTTHSNFGSYLNEAGQVLGLALRYNSAGQTIGQDGWLYNGTTTQMIGLTGTGYEYTFSGTGGGLVRSGQIMQLNDAGQAIGQSGRCNTSGGSLGMEAWIYDGTMTKAIGLTGTGYQYISGGGTNYHSEVRKLNGAGWVAGTSGRFNASGTGLGADTWVYNGTSSQRIGLIGSGHEYTSTAAGGGTFRSSQFAQMNEAGHVTGISARFNASGADLGQDTWLFDGTITHEVGLTGSGYEQTYTGAGGGVFRRSQPTQMNDEGGVAGWSDRYNGSGTLNGRAGWYFDPVTSTTIPLEFSFRASDGRSFTQPVMLTDEGVVLGVYEFFDGAVDDYRMFSWSMDDGLQDLETLIDGGLTDAGWKDAAGLYGSNIPAATGTTSEGFPRYIVGTDLRTDQSGGISVFLLTAVPEPGTVGLLGVGLAAVLWRRSRDVRGSRERGRRG